MEAPGLYPESSGGVEHTAPNAGGNASNLCPERSGEVREGYGSPDASFETQAPEPAPGGYAAEFVFPPDFIGFAGHFPGNPVLPGIAQIMAVLHACGPGLRLRAVKNCKFLRPVVPGERLSVTVERRAGAGAGAGARDADIGIIGIDAVLRVGQERCASMRLLLETIPCFNPFTSSL
jgi:3-hydroxyacyl-[acyl-carrier-protein] dehydratase